MNSYHSDAPQSACLGGGWAYGGAVLEVGMPEAKAAEIATMSFEDALRELEQIVHRLEAGDVPLEDSIRIYERGAALKAHCETRLKEAELKVEKIVLGADGPKGLEKADDL
jgi:exodeoxyribonuclease VII small subunit